MEFFLAIILDIFEQGLIYGIMALGVYMSYKILSFPDISVDGTLPLGAATSAALIVSGVNPWISLLLAFGAGILAGILTGVFHVVFSINKLFSGILVMTIFYSINMQIAGTSNLHLFGQNTIFTTGLATIFPSFHPMLGLGVLGIALLLIVLVKLCLDYFLITKKGLLLRATGSNPQIVSAMGVHPGGLMILGLALSNGLVALSGAVLAQQTSVFNISMGTGTMTMGLASVIIGSVVFARALPIKETTAVILGAILYKALVSIAINLGAPPEMLNFVRGILFFAILLGDKVFRKQIRTQVERPHYVAHK